MSVHALLTPFITCRLSGSFEINQKCFGRILVKVFQRSLERVVVVIQGTFTSILGVNF